MKIYLALYKAKGNWVDKVIRLTTRAQYSHCEIAVTADGGKHHCYSSSPRDGGVRMKTIKLNPDHWDLVPIDVDMAELNRFYAETRGKKYDFWGACGIVIGTPAHPNRYFCSEWAAKLLKLPKPHKYIPQRLGDWAKLVVSLKK